MQLYKEDKEWDANYDDTVNKTMTIRVMNQKIAVTHGKITKMRNIPQIKNWSLCYEIFLKKIQFGILVI